MGRSKGWQLLQRTHRLLCKSSPPQHLLRITPQPVPWPLCLLTHALQCPGKSRVVLSSFSGSWKRVRPLSCLICAIPSLRTVPSSLPPLKEAGAARPPHPPDRCGADPSPLPGAVGFDAVLYRTSFVFSPALACSCPVCFDELLSALILSPSLTTHLQVCNLLLIIHFMRRTGYKADYVLPSFPLTSSV